MVRHNNQLPSNLPQLQNLIKRDPVSYKEEVSTAFQTFIGLFRYYDFALVIRTYLGNNFTMMIQFYSTI